MSKCNKCGSEIIWGKNQNNKTIPLNPDKTYHWDLCKETIRAKENIPFNRDVHIKIGKTIIGKDYYVCNIPEIPF